MSHHPLVQRTLAEMGTAIRTARLLLHEAARVRMTGDKEATILAVNQAKAYSAEVGLEVTTKALRLAGGRGILKELPVERWHRDALAGPVMPRPTTAAWRRSASCSAACAPPPWNFSELSDL